MSVPLHSPDNPRTPLHGERGPRDAQRITLALQPLGLLEGVCDAFQRESMGHDAIEGETLDIPADERQRLGDGPR
jgi:hypothetical protein